MRYTLILELPEVLYKSLERTAAQIGQSSEAVAIKWLDMASRYIEHDPVEQFIGAFNSNCSDWADCHDQYIGKENV